MGPCGHVSRAPKGLISSGAYKCDKWQVFGVKHLKTKTCAYFYGHGYVGSQFTFLYCPYKLPTPMFCKL
jgi:hypothetical protein